MYVGLTVCLFACESDEPPMGCGVGRPAEELAWLREDIQQKEASPEEYTKYQHIAQAEYEGSTVFLYLNCDPSANSVVQVFDCGGEQVGILGDREGDVPFSMLVNATTLWRSEDSECQRL